MCSRFVVSLNRRLSSEALSAQTTANMRAAILSIICLSAFIHLVPIEGARILAVFPFPSPSHMHVLSGLTKALAARGHHLVVVSPFSLKVPMANYTDVNIFEDIKDSMATNGPGSLFQMGEWSIFRVAAMSFNLGIGLSESVLESPKIKKILDDREGFDLVITEMFTNEALYGLAYHFKAPLVLICPFGGFHWHLYGMANPAPTSYVPNAMLKYTSRMSFTERFINTIYAMTWDVGHYLYYLPRQEAISKKAFGPDSPSIHELNALPSLILVNQHFTLNYPRPLLPNIIEVGGMHVSRTQKPLEKEYKDFLDGAKEGAIYFSMGTNVRSDEMEPETIKAFISAFAELPQKILWKWESAPLPGQPKNLKIAPWMPQQEILAHPNVKVFITHGGLLSAQEAAYHGKTMVGVPIFGDQTLNMKRAQLGGYAVLLEYRNVTKESVLWALKEALHNPKIQEASQKRSQQYRDQPQEPLEKAIFWTEYILRHKGAPQLKSAGAELQWFQLNLIDVYAAMLVPILLTLWLCKLYCCRKSYNNQEHSKMISRKKTA